MRTYLVWFWLLMKRAVKKPAFLLLLSIMPLLSFMIDRLGQGESTGAEIGILLEARETEEAKTEDMEAEVQNFLTLLEEQKGILQFRIYENEKKMKQDVMSGGLDCGVLLHADLWEGSDTGIWQDTITLYVTSSSSMTEIVKEKIASIVFTMYSEKNYVNYIEHAEAFAEAEEMSARGEIVSFAREAYETHLLDGSTFAFQYQGNLDGDMQENDGNGHGDSEETAAVSLAFAFRLRGILAVCIFLSGLSGLLTDWKDREEKRFLRLAPPVVTTMVNIWVPTVYTSVAALFSLWLTGYFAAHGTEANSVEILLTGLGKEMIYLIFYQFLIVLYCSIIRMILRKQEAIAAAIPLLTFLCIICCPVWVRLAVYAPLFGVLEKLFPVTYYLLL